VQHQRRGNQAVNDHRSSSDFDPTQHDDNGCTATTGDNDNDNDAMQQQGVNMDGYEGPPPPTKTMAHHHPWHRR